MNYSDISVDRPQVEELADEDQENLRYWEECFKEEDESQCGVSYIGALHIILLIYDHDGSSLSMLVLLLETQSLA